MKYIGVNVTSGNLTRRLVVAFPNDLVHACVAKGIEYACQVQWPTAKIETVTAGDIDLEVFSTSGLSTSPKLAADPKDGDRLQMSDYSLHIL